MALYNYDGSQGFVKSTGSVLVSTPQLGQTLGGHLSRGTLAYFPHALC